MLKKYIVLFIFSFYAVSLSTQVEKSTAGEYIGLPIGDSDTFYELNLGVDYDLYFHLTDNFYLDGGVRLGIRFAF